MHHDAAPLEQVRLQRAAVEGALRVELDREPLAEPRRVLVLRRRRVPPRLEHERPPERRLCRPGAARRRETGEARYDELARLRLAGARVARDQDGLRLARPHQGGEGGARDAVHVRWKQLVLCAVKVVAVAQKVIEVAEPLVRVDRDEDGPDARVDGVAGEPEPQVVKHGRQADVRQRGEVVARRRRVADHGRQVPQAGRRQPHQLLLPSAGAPARDGGGLGAAAAVRFRLDLHGRNECVAVARQPHAPRLHSCRSAGVGRS
mmetsp:Transcript_5658/g.18501  ORF Transcript_5658/g.18501 Transcript_5658/m.18501 type:complete len:262 (+) Transcript_5658:706-1491(+)